jgi:hypothetical protein
LSVEYEDGDEDEDEDEDEDGGDVMHRQARGVRPEAKLESAA